MTKILTFDDMHKYQKRAIVESITNKYNCLFLGTGLGKTIIALTIIDQLLKRKLIRAGLVVAPKKAIFNTWAQEAKLWKHTQYLRFSLIHGDAAVGNSGRVKRMHLLNSNAHVYLINYEGIPWLVDTMDTYLRDRVLPFDLIIYDESTKMKHSTTQRFRKLKRYMGRFRYRYPMTGTPAPNGVMDLFGQIFCMDLGHSLGQNITSFRRRFFTAVPMGNFSKYIPLGGSAQAIRKRIQDRVIYMKKADYVELPPIHYSKMLLDLPLKYRKSYDELEEDFYTELENAKIEAFSKTSLSMKLRQFIQGKMYQGKGKHRKVISIHDEKLQILKDMVDLKQKGGARILEGIGNCIIAYNFQFEREDLKSVFPSAPHIDGSTTEGQAQQWIKEWNWKMHKVMLYNPASDPHGLNLQFGGNQMLWYSLTWNLEHYIQLIDRLHRQRQEKPVFVHHILFRETVDEVIFDALTDKDRTQTGLLEALKAYRQTATGGSPGR